MRARQELAESTQCPRCSGSGVVEHPLRYGPTSCSYCSGSGLTKPPKFRVQCECGEKQPRWTTNFTAHNWMAQHLKSHAPEEPEDFS